MPLIDQIPRERREITFGCQKCGSCCRSSRKDVSVSLYYPDIKRIPLHLECDVREFIMEYCQPVIEDYVFSDNEISARRLELKREGGQCIFLENNRCRIYKDRPYVCRNAPFLFEILHKHGNWEWFSGFCKGVNRGREYAQREISVMLETEELMEQEHSGDFNNIDTLKDFFENFSKFNVLQRKIIYNCSYQDYFSKTDLPLPEVIVAQLAGPP
jgi:Fe-S-cluster containining protein